MMLKQMDMGVCVCVCVCVWGGGGVGGGGVKEYMSRTTHSPPPRPQF